MQIYKTPQSTTIAALITSGVVTASDDYTLLVVFANRSLYAYKAVPTTVIDELLESKGKSVGAAFDRLIKKGGYEYERIA